MLHVQAVSRAHHFLSVNWGALHPATSANCAQKSFRLSFCVGVAMRCVVFLFRCSVLLWWPALCCDVVCGVLLCVVFFVLFLFLLWFCCDCVMWFFMMWCDMMWCLLRCSGSVYLCVVLFAFYEGLVHRITHRNTHHSTKNTPQSPSFSSTHT